MGGHWAISSDDLTTGFYIDPLDKIVRAYVRMCLRVRVSTCVRVYMCPLYIKGIFNRDPVKCGF